MIVLLSIKPKFVEGIFAGSKRFEFRKALFRQPVTHVIVYASAPISMIVGEFEIDELMHDDLELLWQKTKEHAGITEDYFYSYFGEKDKGFAIKVKNAHRFKQPVELKVFYSSPAPQSFAYLPAEASIMPL